MKKQEEDNLVEVNKNDLAAAYARLMDKKANPLPHQGPEARSRTK